MLVTSRASLISLCIDLGLFEGLALVGAVSWLFTEVAVRSSQSLLEFTVSCTLYCLV